MHHFLNEFQYKFRENPEDQLARFNSLLSMFSALETEEIFTLDITEEIYSNFWVTGNLPPSLVLVLRKLQQFLKIEGYQVKMQESHIKDQIEKIKNSISLSKTFQEMLVQTDPLKEFDLNSRVFSSNLKMIFNRL